MFEISPNLFILGSINLELSDRLVLLLDASTSQLLDSNRTGGRWEKSRNLRDALQDLAIQDHMERTPTHPTCYSTPTLVAGLRR